MNFSTLYQSAILQGDKRTPSTSTSLNTTHVTYTSAEPFTPKYVQDHLLATKAKSTTAKKSRLSSSRAQALYDERVRRRQLGLVPRRGANAKKESKKGVAAAAAAVVKREKMGRREAAEMGVWRLREEEARWDAFVPLHRLWLGYMSELLGLVDADADARAGPSSSSQSAPAPTPGMKAAMPSAAGMHAKLVKADFHGSIMTVRRSKNAALVGASGIVVQETENTFKVVTRKDKLKVLPKQGSVFAFAVPLYSTELSSRPVAAAAAGSGTNSGTGNQGGGDDDDVTQGARTTVLDGPHIEFELYGNQFCFRAADRAGRKFKHKETIEL